jgi:excisionase family DNA binding protein
MDDLFSSRQAARILGVGISTIKRWADDGVIACVRTAGGHRRFRKAEIDRALRRQRGQQENGEASVASWIDLLVSDTPQSRIVAELLKEHSQRGAWFRVADYLARVIRALGRRWENGSLSVAEEHVATERLSRALSWVSQTLVVADDGPVCILLTAEGDEHTLGLSLAELAAREAGWKVTWVGRSTPLIDLDRFLAQIEPRVAGISASAHLSDRRELARQSETLTALAERHGFSLVFGGSGAWPEQPHGAERLESFASWSALLSELHQPEQP